MSPALIVYLDFLRFFAAIAVYIFHDGHFSGFRIPVLGNLGDSAVIVFFVLSGLVIAYSADNKHTDLIDFGTARLGRLWSVVLPALILTFAIDRVGQYLALSTYSPMQPYSILKWIGAILASATFTNQIWYLNIWPGTNGPFWSLSYEFWYYTIFAAGYYFRGLKRIILVFIAAAIAGQKILVALPVWCMGVLLYSQLHLKYIPTVKVGGFLWVGTILLLVGVSQSGAHEKMLSMFPLIAETAARQWAVNFWPESFFIGSLVALNIYGFTAVGKHIEPISGRNSSWIRKVADTSFGIYLFHYPLRKR